MHFQLVLGGPYIAQRENTQGLHIWRRLYRYKSIETDTVVSAPLRVQFNPTAPLQYGKFRVVRAKEAKVHWFTVEASLELEAEALYVKHAQLQGEQPQVARCTHTRESTHPAHQRKKILRGR